jgi:hypothetical protein
MNYRAMGVCRIAAAALAGAALIVSAGCEAMGFAAEVIDDARKVEFKAQYTGLAEKNVAILVDAPIDVQVDHPASVPGLTDLLSSGIHTYVEGAQVRPPAQIIAFQQRHVFWPMMDIGDLARVLNVERLILIDIVDYRLVAPGNRYVWDGLLIADVNVYEADGIDPTQPVYRERLTARFPTVDGVRPDQATAREVEQGLQITFAQRVIRLFHDHTRLGADIKAEARRERRRR